jgi:hypothetical protein
MWEGVRIVELEFEMLSEKQKVTVKDAAELMCQLCIDEELTFTESMMAGLCFVSEMEQIVKVHLENAVFSRG